MRLGQITMAVAVQMLVDTVLMRHSPAEVAVPWALAGGTASKVEVGWFFEHFFEDGLVVGFLLIFWKGSSWSI